MIMRNQAKAKSWVPRTEAFALFKVEYKMGLPLGVVGTRKSHNCRCLLAESSLGKQRITMNGLALVNRNLLYCGMTMQKYNLK